MKINEILAEDDLQEGPLLNKIGQGVGKAVGGAGKAVGAVAGGVAGLGQAIKKGYQAGKATVSGAGDDTGSTASAAGSGVASGLAAASGGGASTGAAAADPGAETAAKSLQQQIDKLSPETKQELIKQLQASAEKPAEPAATDTAAPASATTPAAAATDKAAEPDAATQARIAANPQGFDPETGKPNAATTAAPAAAPATTAATSTPATTAAPAAPTAKPAAPANKAASDTFEKAKGDMRKVANGTKPLPDQMAQGVQADIAKMAKGDKESGVAAAQKIMGFAQRGMDVAALQQAWTANAKAGERFLSQSVYRSITNMLREHGLIWSDLNLRVRIDESVAQKGVFIRYARPVVESRQVSLFRIK